MFPSGFILFTRWTSKENIRQDAIFGAGGSTLTDIH